MHVTLLNVLACQIFKSVFTVFRKSTYCVNGLHLVFSTKYTVIGKSILTSKKWHTSHLNLVFSKFTASMQTLTISHTIQHEKQVSTFLWMIATHSHISTSFSHLCIKKCSLCLRKQVYASMKCLSLRLNVFCCFLSLVNMVIQSSKGHFLPVLWAHPVSYTLIVTQTCWQGLLSHSTDDLPLSGCICQLKGVYCLHFQCQTIDTIGHGPPHRLILAFQQCLCQPNTNKWYKPMRISENILYWHHYDHFFHCLSCTSIGWDKFYVLCSVPD